MNKIKRILATIESSHQNTDKDHSLIVSCGIELKKKKGILCVSSRLLAERMKIEHKSVINSATKYSESFKNHGSLPVFKIQSKGQKKEAYFTEDQAYFLLSLSRNTEKVVQLKSDLVRAYSKLRREHELKVERIASLEYQQNKAIGKLHRRDLTDDIKPFIEYAKSQGSKGSNFLYVNITKWINKACGIESIETADERQLANVSTACDIALHCIEAGMTKGSNYKQIKKEVKSSLTKFGFWIGGATNG